MNQHSKWQSLASLAICLGLLLQTLAPLALFPVAQAAAVEQAEETGKPWETAIALATDPSALTSPLAVARTQTSYVSGSVSTISYHVTNNLPPTLLPDVPEGATITDTLDILAAFSLTDDMNSLRNASLTTTVVNGSIIDPGSRRAERQHSHLESARHAARSNDRCHTYRADTGLRRNLH